MWLHSINLGIEISKSKKKKHFLFNQNVEKNILLNQ